MTLLTNQYWRTHLAADPSVIDRVIHVNDIPVQIVGVLPGDFYGFSLQPSDVWFPSNRRALLLHSKPSGQSELFGQLKSGVSLASAMAELTALTRELARQQPRQFGEDDRIQAEPVQDSLLHFFLTRSPVIVIFVGMFALILLSACAHLGNMLLVRGLARQHEFSIRVAIGAGRDRLIRQLVTENVLLAALGSGAGLALGLLAARLILTSLNPAIPLQVSIHWQTIAACVAMTFISVFVFGLPAAREMTRPGFQTSSLRSRFVANQVSVSCVLLIFAGTLAARGRLNSSLDLTVDYQRIIVVDPQLYARESSAETTQLSLEKLVAAFSSLPGVENATIATAVPLRGRVVDNYPRWPRVQRSAVSPSYFDAVGLSVLRGRTFLPGETDVAIAANPPPTLYGPTRILWDKPGRLPETSAQSSVWFKTAGPRISIPARSKLMCRSRIEISNAACLSCTHAVSRHR